MRFNLLNTLYTSKEILLYLRHTVNKQVYFRKQHKRSHTMLSQVTTKSFNVYLNNDAIVSAKCRTTGRFVKRAIAQVEYDLEHENLFKGFYSFMFFIFVSISLLVSHKRLERIVNQIKALNDEKESLCKIDRFRRIRILNCKIRELEAKI